MSDLQWIKAGDTKVGQLVKIYGEDDWYTVFQIKDGVATLKKEFKVGERFVKVPLNYKLQQESLCIKICLP